MNADDIRFYIALSLKNWYGMEKLEECFSSLHARFCFNGLAINTLESEAIIFGSALFPLKS